MGFLSKYDGTEQIPIDEEYWVVIKKHLSSGEYDAAKAALTRVQVDDTTESGLRPDPDVPNYQREVVIAAIVSWNLTDENDGALPLDTIAHKRASVKRLPDLVVTKIYSRINELDKPPTSEEKARFLGTDLGSGEVGEGRTAGAPGLLVGTGDVAEVRVDEGSPGEKTAD